MPFIDEIGGLRQTSEARVEWPIRDFFSLSEEVDSCYSSPTFNFSDSCWSLILFPNGEKKQGSSGYVDLYLRRIDLGPPKTVNFTLAIKKADGKEKNGQLTQRSIVKEHGKSGLGFSKFLSRSELQSQKSEWMPSNILTITCHLKSDVPHTVEVSLFSRLWNLSRHMETMLDEGKETDFTLKVEGREVLAHKVILQNRCPYFAGMFEFDSLENVNREAIIDDIEEDVFQCVLLYLYCGEVEDVSIENVCKIYVAADKLLLEELKKLCIEYMKENLCPDLVCDVLVIADKYEEKELHECALEYFKKHSSKMFSTDQWKELKSGNPSVSFEVLENVVESLTVSKITD